jgi:hypothetical protein
MGESSTARNNTRLELTWIGKENRPKLEPRILIADPARSYHAPHRVSDNDIFDNRLIFADNGRPVRKFGKAKAACPTLFDMAGR